MSPGLLLIPLLTACALDNTRADVESYRTSMQPVLQKNAILAQEFLEVASRVKRGEVDGQTSSERFARSAVPLAQEISTKVSAVHPKTEALKTSHEQLVKAWSNRAIAYRDLATAWQAGDPAAFDAARARDVQVRLDEESYVASVNVITNRYGVLIDLYP